MGGGAITLLSRVHPSAGQIFEPMPLPARISALTTHRDDLSLARGALDGSHQARCEFAVRMRCVARILAVKNRRRGSLFGREELEDLVQETLLTIWKRLPQYEGLSSLETWAYRFCEHSLLNSLRVRSRRTPVLSLPGGEPAADHDRGEVDLERVEQAIDRVGSLAARVVRLHHFEGLTFDAIARHLAFPASTIKTHYYRALDRLRELLQHEGWGPTRP